MVKYGLVLVRWMKTGIPSSWVLDPTPLPDLECGFGEKKNINIADSQYITSE